MTKKRNSALRFSVIALCFTLFTISSQAVFGASLITLTPDRVQAGEAFTFVAETKDTAVFKLWIYDRKTKKKKKLCRNVENTPIAIHQCNATAPKKKGTYDLLIKLKSHKRARNVIIKHEKLIVGKKHTKPNKKPELISLSPGTVQAGEAFTFVAETENAVKFHLWLFNHKTKSIERICRRKGYMTNSIFECHAVAPKDEGTYDLYIKLRGSKKLRPRNRYVRIKTENLTVAKTNEEPVAYEPGTCTTDAPEGYESYFCDEFAHINEDALPSADFWDFQPKQINNELQCYTDRDTNDQNADQTQRNVSIEHREVKVGTVGNQTTETGNYLVLSLRNNAVSNCPGDGKDYQYTSGAVATRVRRNGEYLVGKTVEGDAQKGLPFGRYEIRAKIPSGRGTWPALWMLGHKSGPGGFGTSVGWPDAGEIDIMEAVGFEEARGVYLTHHTLHRTRACAGPESGDTFLDYREPICDTGDTRTNHDASSIRWPDRAILDDPGRSGAPHYLKPLTFWGMDYQHQEPPSANFHIYTLIWEEDSIEILVDGSSKMKARVYDHSVDSLVDVDIESGFQRDKVIVTQNGETKEYYTEGSTQLGWPFSKGMGNEFHLILNLAFGGGYGGQEGVDDTIFNNGPVEMLIDYVRIYTPISSNNDI